MLSLRSAMKSLDIAFNLSKDPFPLAGLLGGQLEEGGCSVFTTIGTWLEICDLGGTKGLCKVDTLTGWVGCDNVLSGLLENFPVVPLISGLEVLPLAWALGS
jgi:hypothetical protein